MQGPRLALVRARALKSLALRMPQGAPQGLRWPDIPAAGQTAAHGPENGPTDRVAVRAVVDVSDRAPLVALRATNR